MVAKFLKSGCRPGLTSEQMARCRAIVGLVARDAGISPGAFFATSRGGIKTAKARQLAMYLCHVLSGLTMTQVGQFFGRDRTTVAYACALIEDARDDRSVDSRIEALEARLSNGEIAFPIGGNTVAGSIGHVC